LWSVGWLSQVSPRRSGTAVAFAGGALLASVIHILAPEAFRDGGPFFALASAAGFFTSFVLSG
jgi:ZIP family zinc transporter